MRTLVIICDHCGDEMEDSELVGFTDKFGTPVQLDLHVHCLAEFAKFCGQLSMVGS